MNELKNHNIAGMKIARKDVPRKWLEITKSLHGLTDTEMDVAAIIVKKRLEYADKISDADLLDNILFSSNIKKEMMEELNIPNSKFFNILTLLKKKGFYSVDGTQYRVTKGFIPNIEPNASEFRVTFLMKIH